MEGEISEEVKGRNEMEMMRTRRRQNNEDMLIRRTEIEIDEMESSKWSKMAGHKIEWLVQDQSLCPFCHQIETQTRPPLPSPLSLSLAPSAKQ